MAMVNFKKGLLANLPAAKSEGTFYVTTDERALYLDVDGSTRIRLGDFQEFATLSELQKNSNPSTTALYYVADVNCLAKWNGSAYVQINLDTGATSVDVVGDGNAITTASYDAATRKITLTKGNTFAELGTAEDGNDVISLYGVKAYAKKVADDVLGTDEDTDASVTVKGARKLADKKVASVSAADNSVTVDNSTATAPKVGVKLSSKEDNALTLDTTEGKEGLYVPIPAAASEYSLKKLDAASAGAAASYQLTKDNVGIGAVIDIPKDMVVESGSVVTVTAAQAGEEGFPENAGTYIKLVIANKTNDTLWIDVAGLIEYVTSGSADGDMVVITIDPATHKVTASITDGTVTKAKLHADVQASLDKADSALQKTDIVEGATNGTIKVKGDDVAVHGLSDGAFMGKSTSIAAEATASDDKVVTEKAARTELDKKANIIASGERENKLVTLTADGDIQNSGKAIGGATLAAEPNANTVATEAAVKSAVETAMTWGSF